jgi:hypothetical protein
MDLNNDGFSCQVYICIVSAVLCVWIDHIYSTCEERYMKAMFVIYFLIVGGCLFAQNYPQWNWAISVNSDGFDSSEEGWPSIAISNTGRKYITGSFSGTMICGGTVLTSEGGEDIFVAKLNASGNYIWARRAGSFDRDTSRDIKIDGMGNCYITGYTHEGIFGSITLFDEGMYVAKLDTDGNWLWVKNTTSNYFYHSYGYSLALDNNLNCFVTGYYNGTCNFGSTQLTSDGADIFVAKLDYSGNWLWTKSAGGSQDDQGYGITCDSAGNCFVTGVYGNWSDPNDPNYNFYPDFQDQVYIGKLSSSGSWLWQFYYGADRVMEIGVDIAVDASGNSYVAGMFGSPLGGTWATTLADSLVGGYREGFVTKFNADGGIDDDCWAIGLGGPGDDTIRSIVLDNTNHLFVAGGFAPGAFAGNHMPFVSTEGSLYVAKLDLNGHCNWAVTANGGFPEGTCVAVNQNHIVAVAGFFSSAIGFNGTNLFFDQNNPLYADACFATISDTQTLIAPQAPTNLGTTAMGNELVLSWDPVSHSVQNTAIVTDYYEIYCSTVSSDGPFSLLDTTEDTRFAVHNIATLPSRMFFYVVAKDE